MTLLIALIEPVMTRNIQTAVVAAFLRKFTLCCIWNNNTAVNTFESPKTTRDKQKTQCTAFYWFNNNDDARSEVAFLFVFETLETFIVI